MEIEGKSESNVCIYKNWDWTT